MEKNKVVKNQNDGGNSVTDIIYVMDRSGSMANIMTDAIGGFNTFVKEQQKVEGDCYLTLIAFDTQYEVIYDRVPILEVKELTSDRVFARGCTALLDTVGKALSTMPDEWHVAAFIMTDGEENSSIEWTNEKVKTLVQNKVDKGWDINFVGVGIDAFSMGGAMGLHASKISNVSKNARGIMDYNALSSTISTSYRTSGHKKN